MKEKKKEKTKKTKQKLSLIRYFKMSILQMRISSGRIDFFMYMHCMRK